MRLPRFRLRTMMVVVAIVALGLYGSVRIVDTVPEGWDVADFERAVSKAVLGSTRDLRQNGGNVVQTELLAWHTEMDNRPLVVEFALAWARVESVDKTRWALVLVGRNPREATGAWWRLGRTSHSRPQLRVFDHPPTNADIYAFTDDFSYRNLLGPPGAGWHRLASKVRLATWYSVVGERPNRFYP